MIRAYDFAQDPDFPPIDNPTGAASANDAAQTHPHRVHADRLVTPRIALRPRTRASQFWNNSDAIAGVSERLDMLHEHLYRLTAPWVIQPPDSESFHKPGGIALPAVGAGFAVVVSIQVPAGRNGVLNKIANQYEGGGSQDFTGNIIWRIVRNRPGTAVAANIASPEPNFENITASLGTAQQPGQIAGIRIFENDVVELLIQNTAIGVPLPQVGGLLGGWFYPSTYDEGF